jgi:hypothetical protein
MDRRSQVGKKLSKLLAVLSMVLLAFVSKNQLNSDDRYMELNRIANARSDFKFRDIDDNIITQLDKGTRGEILGYLRFRKPGSRVADGNYGLKIKILNGAEIGKIYYVYFNVQKQNMKFYTQLPGEKGSVVTTDVKLARANELTENQKALIQNKPDSKSTGVTELIDSSLADKKIAASDTIPSKIQMEELIDDSKALDNTEIAREIPEKLEEVTERVARLSPLNKSESCNTCNIKPPKKCNAGNSYFEEDLIALQTEGSDFLRNLIIPMDQNQEEDGIDLKCVRTALESFPAKRFRQCVPTSDSSTSLRAVKASKPCVTDRLASTLTKSFNIAAKCLKPIIGEDGSYSYKLQKIFEMISQESGFHTNVIGTNDDVGIGQMQNPAVKAVNRLMIDKTQESLSSSDSEDCQNLYKEFLKSEEPIKPTQTCNRIAPKKGNPWKNMIYTFLYFKVNRDILKDTIFDFMPYRDRLQMSRTEMEKLKDELAKLAHNKGAAGASDIFGKQLMRNFNSNYPARSAKEALKAITKSESNYLRVSAAKAASIENAANLSREDSCIRGY